MAHYRTMKTALVIAISVLIFSTSVSAQTLPTQEEVRERAERIRERDAEERNYEELKKRDTSVEKRARKELEREIKRERDLTLKNFEIARRASVTGCDSEVVVSERATQRSMIRPRVLVRITNPYNFPIDIDDGEVVVVRGLCPKGSVTVSRVRQYWRDGDYFYFQYNARGIFPDGSVGTAMSQQFSLSVYDAQNGRMQQNFTWPVQLYRTYVQN